MSFSFNKGKRIARIKKGDIFQRTNLNLIDDTNSKKTYKDVELTDGCKFQISPCIQDERMCYNIYGPSGCGKSSLCSTICKEYRRIFPRRKIFLLSKKPDDPVFDEEIGLRIKRIPVNETLIDDPITLEELSAKPVKSGFKDFGCLIIFDDYETFSKDLQRCVYELRDTCLELGRSYHISVMILSHLGCTGNKSKIVLNECQYVIYFEGTNPAQNKRVMEIYCGMNKDNIKRITNCKSRWKAIHKSYPQYIITEQEAWFIDHKIA